MFLANWSSFKPDELVFHVRLRPSCFPPFDSASLFKKKKKSTKPISSFSFRRKHVFPTVLFKCLYRIESFFLFSAFIMHVKQETKASTFAYRILFLAILRPLACTVSHVLRTNYFSSTIIIRHFILYALKSYTLLLCHQISPKKKLY